MTRRRVSRWLPVAAVVVIAGLVAGFVVSRSGEGDAASPSASASRVDDSDPVGTVAGEVLAGPRFQEPLASVDGAVLTIPGGVAKPAVAQILGLEADGRSTLMTWRLEAVGGTETLHAITFTTNQSGQSDFGTTGVVLAAGDQVVQPFRNASNRFDCICSQSPVELAADGQVLTSLYPDLGAEVTAAEVRIPGFPALPGVPITRLTGDDRSQAGRVVSGSADTPVEAVFEVRESRDSTRPIAYGAVNGVRRVDGATFVHFSVGYPQDSSGTPHFLFLQQLPERGRWRGPAGFVAAAIDPVGKKKYTPLIDGEEKCLCTDFSNDIDGQQGKLFVFVDVLPELPAGVDFVDLDLGFDTIVRGVPVTDGALTPSTPGSTPVELGEGWPTFDPAVIASAPAKEESIVPLASVIENPTGDLTVEERSEQLSVELATDVLFEVDSSELGPQAQERIGAAAEILDARASGPVAVVGHTDNTGTPSHNDQLSQARAQAVLAALQPLVTAPGVTFSAEGRGEREPVVDNGSEEGRQANRRVEITFVPKEK